LVKIKICGITNLEDAVAAIVLGADALGFVFYKKSPRYIAPQKASKIIRVLPKNIIKMGVFVDAQAKTIKRIAKLCHLDMLQFHGNESPEFCRRFKDYRIIKALRVKDSIDSQNMLRYRPFAYLFDTFIKSKPGGTGKKFDWQRLKKIKNKIRRPIFLSGGLTAKNVKRAIKYLHPDWVDVSSSIEIRPGKKDHRKIRKFIAAVKTRS
jgi:phosphoribosylanthranilate isomerase